MTITFKQFVQLVELEDAEFQQLEEGLSDLPGFGWLKGKDNKAKLAKIDAARAQLKSKRDAKSKELDAQFAALKAKIENPSKPAARGAVSHDDLDSALSSSDRKFNAKDDKQRDTAAAEWRFKMGMR